MRPVQDSRNTPVEAPRDGGVLLLSEAPCLCVSVVDPARTTLRNGLAPPGCRPLTEAARLDDRPPE